MKSWVCKVYLLGQDMSLDELIEKDYLPPKVQTGLTNHDLLGMAQEKLKF